jgi:hypothetical protein
MPQLPRLDIDAEENGKRGRACIRADAVVHEPRHSRSTDHIKTLPSAPGERNCARDQVSSSTSLSMVPIEQSGKSVLLAELTSGGRQDPHGSRLSTEPFVSEKVAGQRYPHLSPRSAVRKLESLYRLSVMPIDGDNWNQILERKLQNTLLPTIVKKPASKKQTEAKQSTRKGSRALGKIDLDEGPDAPPIQQQIAAALCRNAGKVLDLFREWDANGDGEVSKKEFRKAMPAIGLDVRTQLQGAKQGTEETAVATCHREAISFAHCGGRVGTASVGHRRRSRHR